jgi:poly(3-hydroxybutyrate) depolymerase
MNTDEHGWMQMTADSRSLLMALGAAALLAVSTASLAATPVPSGKGSFVFTDAKGRADKPMRVFTYRPRQCDENCPIQFVLHGQGRTAANYRDYWEPAADRYGFLVVVPEFTKADWPGGAGYNRGDVDATQDRNKWGFLVVEHLFDEVRTTQKDYRIFGHSAGAQFLHRFLYFVPENRSTVAVAANAGWYTLPEWRDDKVKFRWPHSLAGAKVGEKEARQALSRRLLVLLGEGDTDPNASDLDKTPGSMAQGANRVERGALFIANATALAGELGVPFRWELAHIPGTAHEGSKMSRAAADLTWGAGK